MDGKKSVLIAAGIVVLAAIIVVVAYGLLQPTGIFGNAEAGSDATGAQATTGDSNVPRVKATPFAQTVVSPTPKPTAVASGASEPLGIVTNANKTFGTVIIGLEVTDGKTNVDMSKVSVEAECNGKTYSDLWSLKPTDWTSSDGDSILEPGEIVTIVINSKAKGIPVDQQMTIRLLESGKELKKITATPV